METGRHQGPTREGQAALALQQAVGFAVKPWAGNLQRVKIICLGRSLSS